VRLISNYRQACITGFSSLPSMPNMGITFCDVPRKLLLYKTSQKKCLPEPLLSKLKRALGQDILWHPTLASAVFPLKSTRTFPSAEMKCDFIPTGSEIPSTNSYLKPDKHISAQ